MLDELVDTQVEIDATIEAAALLYNNNQWGFDHAAWKIVGKNWPGATKKLAQLCGAVSADWVEGRAHTYRLKRELVMWRTEMVLDGCELDKAFRTHFRQITELPESYFRAVALKLCAKDEALRMTLPECLKALETFTRPTERGEDYTIDTVRNFLPHTPKAVNYDALVTKFKKLLPHFEMPVTLGMSKEKREIVFQIADVTKQYASRLNSLFEQLQKEG